MVYNRINILRYCAVIVMAVFFAVLLFLNPKTPEFSLIKAILPQDIVKTTDIIPLSDKTSSAINLIFEQNDEDELEDFEHNVLNEINPEHFEIADIDVSKMLQGYSSSPSNFLSVKTRKTLNNGDYETIYQEGLERLYNPVGIMFSDFEKDPYSFLSDFLLSNKLNSRITQIGDKYYLVKTVKIKQGIRNDTIKELINLQTKYNSENQKLYLSGTPVHTYLTSRASADNVNFICILITVLIAVLTWIYFKNLKLLLPIALSIAFGFLGGISVAKATFHDFHIITLLFAMTLIGIGVDYSLHYVFSENRDKTFYKNLTLSLISTVSAFLLLFLLNIEILNQIALFTVAGLISVYLFIILIYPCLDFPKPVKSVNIKFNKIYRIVICAITIAVIGLGALRLGFDDNLSALYTPNKSLKEAEMLYSQLSKPEGTNSFILVIKGENNEDILQKEEMAGDILSEKGINYISLSKFMPSEKRQRENFELVKKLYEKNYFSDILTPEQLSALREGEFKAVIPDETLTREFMLSPSSSVIMYFAPERVELNLNFVQQTDIQNTVSASLKEYRIHLIKLLPFVYLVLMIIVTSFYGLKQGFKMIFPIILSSFFTVCLLSACGIYLNLFHFLGLMLVLGFTVDYSLFGVREDINTQNAIFLACITTSASFLLLSFTTFNLLNSLALTLFIGIVSSYIFIKAFSR